MTNFEEDFNYLIRLSGDVESFEKNRIAFFEKYKTDQTQPLPVVPEDVDKAIKYLKKHHVTTFGDFDDILTNKGLKWLNEFQFKDRRFGFGGLNNKLFIIPYLAITGYEVEKTQLFKIIFPNSTTVLQKDGELNSFADTVYKKYLIANAMTEQEIKSIDERYWQFAVPVEDGEFQEPLNTAKKYIEDAIGTIKHDGHLGTIQIDWILPYLEKALAAIGVDNE